MIPPMWRKSSRSSDGTNPQCIELAALAAAVGIRDSKTPGAGHLELSRPALAALLREIKSGKYGL